MKKAISLITISFLLMFIAGCTVVQPVQQPTPTKTVDVKKENKKEPKENKRGARTYAKNKAAEQKTNPTQTVATPKAALAVYNLKVTLTDIQTPIERDGYKKSDDYGIQQYIVYKALGKEKKFISRDINKFRERINLGGQVPNIKNMLINGDMNNQIHVKGSVRSNMRNRNMINNSLVFQITSKELEDPNASFKIYTWLKEYSSTNYVITTKNDDKVLMNNVPVPVNVKDVIEILSGVKSLNENTNFPIYWIVGKFHNSGPGYLYLTKNKNANNFVLEGPIVANHSDTVVAVWVQFELTK